MLPVPSMIPVMSEIALLFPRREGCFPRSAVTTVYMMLLVELFVKPKKNIRANN
jgi:hypothetical protein